MLVVPFYIKLALGFLLAGFVFHLIGFATPYWTAYDTFSGSVNNGLWTLCWDTRVGRTCNSYSANTAISAARAFEVLAFLMFIAIVVLLFVYLSTLRTNLQLASVICTFILVAFIVLGAIIYASERSNLSWSFALCIIGAILAFIAGILLIIYRMRGVTMVTGGAATTRTTRTVTTTVVVR
ncbi:lens fiber membrane intrinsic protein-like [Mizuhopecten yessoensis]|uniref:Uncharacterized protein n=1 Tax=Mizuhopecten yessoensis TaxID=6573 RepID=A0A210R336_MIZYE|nr:lens fiber membrane intrinsic protein-like [Mizuhopecten yessoensis]OWF55419.1 hypothetical protein KP79_PYT10468 [Mizuhopecten yessoensis]